MGIRKSRRLRNFLMIFLFVMSLFIGIGSAEDVSLYGEMTLSSHTNPEQTPIMTFSIGAGSDTEANLYVRDLNGNLVAVSSMMVLNSDLLTPIIEGGGEGEIENSLFPDSFWGYYVVTGDTVMIDGTIDISAYINDFANPLPDSLTNTYDVTLWRADESDGVETTTSACVVIDVSGPTIDLVDDGSGLEEAPYVMLNISDLDGIVDPDRDGVIDNYLLGTFVNWNVPGDYTLIYNYQDSAGNQTSTSRLIRVLAPDEVALRINGRLYSDQTLAFDPGELEVETFNTKGNYEIQIKNYTVKKGQFKSRQDFLNETFIQGISGYYTVLLQDQERSWDMVIFKINE